MMELSHSLTLNEEVLAQIAEPKRPVFVFEWLCFLDRVLVAAQKSDIKGCQKKLVEQLTTQIHNSPGPPTRKLIARCLATLFSVGDTFLLFDTINKCNDILKSKDDSPSYLPTRLSAIACVGAMYEKLGRMMGRSYEETVQILVKSLRNVESQARIEIMITLEKVCAGLGSAASNVHKEIYKAAKHCMTDRVMAVRCAAAKCLLEMLKYAPFLYTTELESLSSLCFRAFDGSNYDVRCAVAKLLGTLVASTQQQPQSNQKMYQSASQNKATKSTSLEEALGMLMSGFSRGGIGFLKGTGEMIKGSSNVSREVRVGVTHSYVIFVQTLGGTWLERNLSAFLSHVLDLVANPKAATSHVDAVYSRKCVNFILRKVLGKMLGEKAQASACKELCHIIVRQMNSIDFNPENAKDCNQETIFSQHLLVCALHETGSLMLALGTTSHSLISDPALNFVDAVYAVLLHPSQAARLSAAWCLRCICVADPSQLTPLVDRCIEGLENLRTSVEAIAGYSSALAALLGCVRMCPLGIPHTRGKIIFNTAEELLRSASQNSRLSLPRTQAGWMLIGAIMMLGTSVVRGLLPRMLLLWRNSFPRSAKELESEKARGDAFTWQVTLEGRAGALSAMYSFLLNCTELVTDDIVRRLLTPIESALAMLLNIGSMLKSYGQHLKAAAAMVRLRLYETLTLLPPQAFEGSFTHLLRILVAEFTLSENPANTTTSLLRQMCHVDDSVILGSWLQETDHRSIEDQMEPNRRREADHLQPHSAAGSGAIEHDPCSLYRPLPQDEKIPGPLPLGVAVIDMSVTLFGLIFPRVANKHRLQMLEHFGECIRQAKSNRQEAVQMNIFTAILSGLKGLTETKSSFGQDDVKKAASVLILNALSVNNPILQCAAGEALGRTAQVVSDARFTAEMAQRCFDKLKSARDAVSRTGHSLALGCVHRYVGGMGSGHHLKTSVSILLALAQDASSPIVQVWALHALALIADSGGPMFRGYVEPTLSLALKLLLNVPQSYVDVHQCIGKCLSALITTVGPELQGNTNSVCTARGSFLCACAIMQDHSDPLVKAEAIACLQQLHMFAPRHVNLSSLVPTLCRTLCSSHLLLRRAAVSCLRQLAQREAREVCDHAMTLLCESKEKDNNNGLGPVITENGLPGVLFGMLDTEADLRLVNDVHDTLISMVQTLAEDNLTQWLSLCKDVLTVASEWSLGGDGAPGEGDGDGEQDDDELSFRAGAEPVTHPAIQPRWPTRIFAAECVSRIVAVCEDNRAHFDLALAKELQTTKGKGDYLVLHLSDLIRMAFMAATSDSDQLRLEGLKTLQLIIDKFAKVPEPEFQGHVILEQYQAQVGAALRPAFSPETPSHVTAVACQVCSAWIGSGVARDLNDLRRVHQLLVSSLAKLKKGAANTQLYNESASTLEKLAILKAWAEVYVVAMKSDNPKASPGDRYKAESPGSDEEFGEFESKGESLLNLVQPELVSLSKHWLAALKDHALLSLPPEFASQLPHDGGAFYTNDTIDSARPYYRASWPPILHAATLWLNAGGFQNLHMEKSELDVSGSANLGLGPANAAAAKSPDDINTDRFHLIFGICMEALCSPTASEPLEYVTTCLESLLTLLNSDLPRQVLGRDKSLGIELCNVLHRLILTRDSLSTHMLAMDVLKLVVQSAQETLDANKKRKLKEIVPANQERQESPEVDLLGEGGENGQIIPGQSLVFSALEVCLCILIRQIPSLNPSPPPGSDSSASSSAVASALSLRSSGRLRGGSGLGEEGGKLVAAAVTAMEVLINLCSPAGAVEVLSTILYLTTGVLKETSTKSVHDETILAMTLPVSASLHSLKSMANHPYAKDTRCYVEWRKLLLSTLAKILDLAKTGSEETRLDEVTLLLSIAVFVLHAPADLICSPNLQYPCINEFQKSFQSSSLAVKMKCVQTLHSIFQHPNRAASTPYIHALAPRIVEFLYTAQSKQVSSEAELALTLECLQCVETLVNMVDIQSNTKDAEDETARIQMLTLLVPILVNYLLDLSSLKEANRFCRLLHEHCLQKLMKIGPLYPQEFRTLMSQLPEMRLKVESAVKANQKGRQQQQEGELAEGTASGTSVLFSAPTIKLKTDFSNFTG